MLTVTKTDNISSKTSIALALGTIVYVATCWPSLPDKIPMHFNYLGRVDNWGPKGLVWLLPGMYLGILALGLFIRHHPNLMNIPADLASEAKPKATALSQEMLSLVNLQIGIMFSYITFAMVRAAQGDTTGLGVWFMPVVVTSLSATTLLYFLRIKRLKRK